MSARAELEFPAWPQFDDAERAGLLRALEQGQWWRVGGAEVTAFEEEFARHHGARRALAVTNGTHALQLALEVLGLAPGEEVLVPAFTFISSSLAVQLAGGVPVPVDVDPDTYCMSPDAASAAVTDRTRVIMPVHMAGQVSDVDALGKVAADAGVLVLQDAAHAHGARWRGRRIGELEGPAAFSFQNGKLMTAGEGGAVLFDDDAMWEEAFVRHSCGRPRTDRHYRHRTSGSNFRMGEFAASVLRAQLARLEEQISVREQRWAVLRGLLSAIPGVRPQGADERCDRNPHYMAMFRVPGLGEQQRDELVDRLVGAGLPAFVGFRAVHRTEGFWRAAAPALSADELAERCPNSERLSRDCVWLHHRVLLGSEEQMHAVAALVAEEVGRL
ncbi:DegT/DnrJ/EryC1/StrS family aminotransferase [Saccharopolyspora rosea]|uniref:DegT/DnrJ/EryC1/StrS family aminotransferase n=1 Tax=Saccharopolyspora rosea TaxID=524884 RepID=A0ABW3FW08_9PSEU|nr:DegT/DnrJ/EryC1/StrS family aminotransferase [Saccharopolyspora rosea]